MLTCSICSKLINSSKSGFCRPCMFSEMRRNSNRPRCLDCGLILPNREKCRAKRCSKCRMIFLAANKKGRYLPLCSVCGKVLSQKKNKTGKCMKCTPPVSRKGLKLGPAWNKGRSRFSSPDEAKTAREAARKVIRSKEGARGALADRIRTLIRNQIKRYCQRKKQTKTEEYLGCSANEFRAHIESLFIDGMSWDNYGNGVRKWNIDHIMPVSRFDISDIEQAKTVFNYKNCRPMWSIDNFKKGSKMPTNGAFGLTGVVSW